MFELGNVQRVMIAIVGAIIFTSATVGAAVGPARAIESTPVDTYAAASGSVLANG